MSISMMEASDDFRLCHDTTVSWWDDDTECTLVAADPLSESSLWAEYVAGAVDSYRRHGVEQALDLSSLADPRGTSLFLAALDDSGRMVAGVRAKGPYLAPEDSHALVEWHGQAGASAVRKLIDDRIPFGVVEIKTAWVTDDPDRNRSLTNALARFPLHSTFMLGAQFAMATSAAHVLARWRSSGGVVASQIPATPYPDERYETKMMWWDRRLFAKHAAPNQVSRTYAELRLMAGVLDELDETSALAGLASPTVVAT